MEKANTSPDKIHIQISPATIQKKENGVTKTLFGATQPGAEKKEGQSGENIDVFILEGSINKEMNKEFKGLNKDQAIGVTLNHELEHATNKDALSRKAEEKAATKIGDNTKQEFKELNKEKEDEK
jgi:hypothetical protein